MWQHLIYLNCVPFNVAIGRIRTTFMQSVGMKKMCKHHEAYKPINSSSLYSLSYFVTDSYCAFVFNGMNFFRFYHVMVTEIDCTILK